MWSSFRRWIFSRLCLIRSSQGLVDCLILLQCHCCLEIMREIRFPSNEKVALRLHGGFCCLTTLFRNLRLSFRLWLTLRRLNFLLLCRGNFIALWCEVREHSMINTASILGCILLAIIVWVKQALACPHFPDILEDPISQLSQWLITFSCRSELQLMPTQIDLWPQQYNSPLNDVMQVIQAPSLWGGLQINNLSAGHKIAHIEWKFAQWFTQLNWPAHPHGYLMFFGVVCALHWLRSGDVELGCDRNRISQFGKLERETQWLSIIVHWCIYHWYLWVL